MKSLHLSLILVLSIILTTSSCSEDEPEKASSNEDLVGEWSLVNMEYSGTSSVESQGSVFETSFDGKGYDMDLTLTFTTDPNEYISSGSYSIALTIESQGQTSTADWENQDFIAPGTWQISGNQLIVDSEIGGKQTVTISELNESSFKMEWEVDNSYSSAGANVTQLVVGAYSFEKK
ncbi:MAG: lipocalin family protein [Cyclobacteriaceae bacterium]